MKLVSAIAFLSTFELVKGHSALRSLNSATRALQDAPGPACRFKLEASPDAHAQDGLTLTYKNLVCDHPYVTNGLAEMELTIYKFPVGGETCSVVPTSTHIALPFALPTATSECYNSEGLLTTCSDDGTLDRLITTQVVINPLVKGDGDFYYLDPINGKGVIQFCTQLAFKLGDEKVVWSDIKTTVMVDIEDGGFTLTDEASVITTGRDATGLIKYRFIRKAEGNCLTDAAILSKFEEVLAVRATTSSKIFNVDTAKTKLGSCDVELGRRRLQEETGETVMSFEITTDATLVDAQFEVNGAFDAALTEYQLVPSGDMETYEASAVDILNDFKVVATIDSSNSPNGFRQQDLIPFNIAVLDMNDAVSFVQIDSVTSFELKAYDAAGAEMTGIALQSAFGADSAFTEGDCVNTKDCDFKVMLKQRFFKEGVAKIKASGQAVLELTTARRHLEESGRALQGITPDELQKAIQDFDIEFEILADEPIVPPQVPTPQTPSVDSGATTYVPPAQTTNIPPVQIISETSSDGTGYLVAILVLSVGLVTVCLVANILAWFLLSKRMMTNNNQNASKLDETQNDGSFRDEPL